MIVFDPLAFRASFPELIGQADLRGETLVRDFANATTYIDNRSGYCFGGGMTVAQRTRALYLMTAHLLVLSGMVTQGNVPGLVQAATIDKVNVTLTPPPARNQFQWWLSLTAYGQQLLALLQVASVGGFYASSAVPGRAGFRFGNGW